MTEFEPMETAEAEELEIAEEAEADERELDENGDAILSDEEIDQVADTAHEIFWTILDYFGASEETTEIMEYEGDEGQLILDACGGELSVLIGRHGRNLQALQTMVTSILYHRLGFSYPVTIDVESYKHRMGQKISQQAIRAAQKAYKQDREVRMKPMTAYERRLVHMALREDKHVETVSEGREPNRYVVVRPV